MMIISINLLLLVIFIIIYIYYLCKNTEKYNEIIIFIISILFLLLFINNTFMNQAESFYFEVSPKRLKCLKEQVSTSNKSRSCNCCQKGTVGGYPPKYLDWINNPSSNGNWSRTDNWTNNPERETDLPPTNYV